MIKIIKSADIKSDLINDIVNLVRIERSKIYFNKRLHNSDYYTWKLKSNPFGAYIVVNYSNEALMSFCTFTAKGNAINDTCPLYELGDVYVSNQVQGRGFFYRMLRKFHKEFPNIKVYGTPNSAALPSELKAGYRQLDINIKYSFMPFGFPLFHFLKNNFFFAKYFYKIDFFTRRLNLIFYLFIKNINCKALSRISSINSKSFSSSLFAKSKKYLLWRYVNSPENYKYLISEDGNDIVIYKKIFFKNIPLAFIVDHNIHISLKKTEMLKQLLKQEVVFGIFEMTASYKNLFLPRVCSFKLKKINFIVFGDIFKKDCSFDDFNFLAGDSDSV
jgi:hypothetical protein